MNIERERKFLVESSLLPRKMFDCSTTFLSRTIRAGYFTETGPAVRVTISSSGVCKFCVKSAGGTLERAEYEYDIPAVDAEGLMLLAPTALTKVRFNYEGWEIDSIELFHARSGERLWIAEWEERSGKRLIPDSLPIWIVREVTEDQSYSNQALAWKYGKKT